MNRYWAGLAAFAALGIAAVVILFARAGRDIAAPDVTDFVLERPDIAPEANSYTHFLAATNGFFWPTNSTFVADYLDGQPVSEELIANLAAENAGLIDVIRQGADCGVCLTPEVTSFDTLTPYLSPWRNMGKFMALMTRYDRLAGRYAEATDACVTLLRFGDLVQTDAGCLIDYLVGISIVELGLNQARDLACDTALPRDDLKRLVVALTEVGPFAPGLVRAIKVEFRVVAQTVDDFVAGRFSLSDILGDGWLRHIGKGRRLPGYFFQPNKTLNDFATLYRDAITNVPLTYSAMKKYDTDAFVGTVSDRLPRVVRPNAVGSLLGDLVVPALDNILERKCRLECSANATLLIAGINLFKKDTGHVPGELADLVPAYLAAVPLDPYDGEPFHYAPAEGLVYAVGKDVKDSGGSTLVPGSYAGDKPSSQRWEAEDVVFRFEAQPPEKP